MKIEANAGTLTVSDKFDDRGRLCFNAAIYDYQGQAYLDKDQIQELIKHLQLTLKTR